MIVEELIEQLKNGNPKAEVICFDEFFNKVELNKYNFQFRHYENNCFDSKKEANILEVSIPNASNN